MTLYKKRNKFSGPSKKIGDFFSNFGLTPNQWTFLSIIFALIGIWFLVHYDFILAGIFVLISVFLDVVDGAVARTMKKATKKGAYLDTMVDRYVEAIIIAGILVINLPGLIISIKYWLFAYLFGSLMTTYAKAAAKEKDLTKTEVRGGVLERTDRVIILIIGIFLAGLDLHILTYAIVLLAILSNISVLQRAWVALSK